MDIELIDKAWACLPKEFKEEVKEIYLNAVVRHPGGYNHKTDLLKYLFGHHNLTSDAEEEEMLTVPRKKVQRAYNTSREIVKAENPDSLMYSMHTQIMCVLENIFGSKCLPDEDAHEDNFAKFKVGDKVRVKFNAKELHSNPDPSKNIYYWQTARDKYLGKVFKITDIWKSGTITLNTAEVMFWEPFDLEPYTEPKDDKHFDNILKDGFRDHNRLHIAAMIAQGIMANSNPQMVDTNVERVVDLAILTADTLIKKAEGGSDE